MLAEDYIKKGNDLALGGKISQAAIAYQKAIDLDSDNVLGWGNLGVMQEKMDQNDLAEKAIRKALELAPDYGKGAYNLGMLLIKIGKPEEAIQYFEKAVETNPDKVEFIFNQGVNLQRLNKINDHITAFEKVAKLNPNYPEIYYRLWLAYRQTALWGRLSSIEPMLKLEVENDPFINLVRSEDPGENLKVAKRVSARMGVKRKFKAIKRRNKKIRLGYFSGDLREHPVGQMVSGMFPLHDRSRFEVVALSSGKDDGSVIRKKIKAGVDEFVDLSKKRMTDEEMAGRIHEKKIDILIEMTGYTKDKRLGVCAYRPSRIQVEWLGFPGTTGAGFIDYAMVDRIIVPLSQQPYFTEKLIYLPHCYQVNTPIRVSRKKYKRTDWGLPEKGFVFGSFNQLYKIEPVLWKSWMKILLQVPGSVLWLWNQHSECARNLKKEAKKRGVESSRIIFSKMAKKNTHLSRIRLTDLGLDTLIYGGHTTTTDYLWAGVPVVTKIGTHFSSRVAASILTEAGLTDLITHDLKSYEDLAIRLANSHEALQKYKKIISHTNLKKNLFNTKRFVGNLEAIYEKMLK